MRILYLTTRIPVEPMDGASRVVSNQIQHLRKRGHHVCVVAPNTSRHHAEVSTLNNFADELITVDVDTSISLKGAVASLLWDRTPKSVDLPRMPYSIGRFISSELRSKLHAHVARSEPYDMIHVEFLVMLWYALDLKASNNSVSAPILYRAHNIEYRIMQHLSHDHDRSFSERMYRALLAKQMEAYETAIVQRTDFNASVSEDDVRWLATAAPRVKHGVIPPGMDIVQVNQPTVRDGRVKTIGILGSLEWLPNIEGIIWFVKNVFPSVRFAVPGVQFVIAGRAPTEDILHLHNGEDVIVIGPVDSAHEFLSTLDVAVAPTISGSGVRIKILEGLAHALPMVTTSIGAEGLLVKHGVDMEISDTPQAFADSCIRLLNNTSEARAMGMRGQDLIRDHYSWNRSTQAVLDAYASIA